MADEEEFTVHNLATFQLGELPDGYLALLLPYATTPEKLARREMESFVIALSRDKATELGRALIEQASSPASGGPPTGRQS